MLLCKLLGNSGEIYQYEIPKLVESFKVNGRIFRLDHTDGTTVYYVEEYPRDPCHLQKPKEIT